MIRWPELVALLCKSLHEEIKSCSLHSGPSQIPPRIHIGSKGWKTKSFSDEFCWYFLYHRHKALYSIACCAVSVTYARQEDTEAFLCIINLPLELIKKPVNYRLIKLFNSSGFSVCKVNCWALWYQHNTHLWRLEVLAVDLWRWYLFLILILSGTEMFWKFCWLFSVKFINEYMYSPGRE